MRLTTHTFARLACTHLENGAKLAEAMELPMVADILATLDGPRPMRAFILAPYQVMKSAIGQLHLARNFTVRPGPALWYNPTDKASEDFAELKFNPLFDANPTLRNLLYADRSKRAKLRMTLSGGSSLLILSANTENARHGKTARDLYLDEVHTYNSGWIAQIENRRGSYGDEYLELLMSTGLNANSEAAMLWAKTDQRTWHCRCPKCRELFEPLYLHRDPKTREICGGLRYERTFLANGLPDEKAIAATLKYECPNCHEKFDDTNGTRSLFSGTARDPEGAYVVKNPNAAPRNFGWNFHAVSVRAWLPLVLRFETAQLARGRGDLEPLADCIREEFAGIWTETEHHGEARKRPAGEYVLGDAWAEEGKDPLGRPIRAATVDVQLDYFVLVIRAWSKTATRLRWCEKVTTPSRIRDLCMEHGVIPERVYLDGRHETQYTRRIAAQNGWRVLLGEEDKDYYHKTTGLRRIFSEPRMIDAYAGTGIGSGVIAEVNFSKQSALSRLHLLRAMPPDVAGNTFWTAAKDAPEWYWKEIEGHYRVRKKNPDGSEYQMWQGLKEDHAGDCEAMQIVFASMAGLIGAESLPVAEQSKKP